MLLDGSNDGGDFVLPEREPLTREDGAYVVGMRRQDVGNLGGVEVIHVLQPADRLHDALGLRAGHARQVAHMVQRQPVLVLYLLNQVQVVRTAAVAWRPLGRLRRLSVLRLALLLPIGRGRLLRSLLLLRLRFL